MKFKDDYARAGVPMLPVVRSESHVINNIIVYAWVMVGTSLLLIPVASMGWVYSIAAIALGAGFLVMAYQLRRASQSGSGVIPRAMRLFHGSITYLALLFLAVAVDPFIN